MIPELIKQAIDPFFEVRQGIHIKSGQARVKKSGSSLYQAVYTKSETISVNGMPRQIQEQPLLQFAVDWTERVSFVFICTFKLQSL